MPCLETVCIIDVLLAALYLSTWLFRRGWPQDPVLSPLGIVTRTWRESGVSLVKANGDMTPSDISSVNDDKLWQHVCQQGHKQNILMVLIACCWAEVVIWGFAGQTVSADFELEHLDNVQFSLPLHLSLCLSLNGSFAPTHLSPFPPSLCKYHCSN